MLTATSTSCFKSAMFSNNRFSPHNELKHKLAQTPTDTHHCPNTQIDCSLTQNSFTGGMGSSSPDMLWSQIFTVSITLSETRSTPKNCKSQLDILCALLVYANHCDCWSNETFHVISYTSCCSAEGKEDGRLWGWKKGREGGGKGRKQQATRRITASEELICYPPQNIRISFFFLHFEFKWWQGKN